MTYSYADAGHAAHYQHPELFLRHSKLFLDLQPISGGNQK
jgi:hypothetical protein